MDYAQLGGLLSAVVLNMLVVPALYLRYGVETRPTKTIQRDRP
ncbi:MAG TPA: hypothetical protein VF263_10925 [Longimicrobiaceae bacterium]